MAVGCGAKFAKVMLIIFNVVFWLSGAALLGIGIWFTVDKNIQNLIAVARIDPGDNYIQYIGYAFIAIGAFVVIVGFCGCCGAIQENQCLLGTYIALLFIILGIELAAGILAYIYKDKLEATLQNEWRNKLQNATYNDTVGVAMAYIQMQFNCCGVSKTNGYDDFLGTTIYAQFNGVPPTCCIIKPDSLNVNAPSIDYSMAVNDVQCRARNPNFIKTTGCYDGLVQYLSTRAIILIGLGLGIACLELFGIIFAFCLCRNVGEED